MDEIFEKLKSGTALTKAEAVNAAAVFYAKLHQDEPEFADNPVAYDPDGIDLHRLLLDPFARANRNLQIQESLKALTQEELTGVMEKFHLLNKQNIDLSQYAQFYDELRTYMLKHLAQIDASSPEHVQASLATLEIAYVQDLAKSQVNVSQADIAEEKFFLNKHRKKVDEIMALQRVIDESHGHVSAEQALSIMLKVQVEDPTMPSLHFTQEQALNLVESYGTVRAPMQINRAAPEQPQPYPEFARLEKSQLASLAAFYEFEKKHIFFPREIYDFSKSVIDQTLAYADQYDFKSLKDLKDREATNNQSDEIPHIATLFMALPDEQKISYLQDIADKYCTIAGIPTVRIATSQMPWAGSSGQGHILIDFVEPRIEEDIRHGHAGYVMTMKTLFHELTHQLTDHMQGYYTAHKEDIAQHPESNDFRYETGHIATTCAGSWYADVTFHDALPKEKIATIIANGYLIPALQTYLSPSSASPEAGLTQWVKDDYPEEFNLSHLGDLPVQKQPAPADPSDPKRQSR